MTIINFDSNEKNVYAISKDEINWKGKKSVSVYFNMENHQKVINLSLLACQTPTNEVLLDIAREVADLFHKNALISLEYSSGETIQAKRISWNQEEELFLPLPLNLASHLHSLKAAILVDDKDLNALCCLYKQEVNDLQILKDIEEILPFFCKKESPLLKKTVKFCIDVYTQIPKEMRERVKTIITTNTEIQPKWYPCFFLIVEQAIKEPNIVRYLDFFTTWQSIIDAYDTFEALYEKCSSLGISFDTKDMNYKTILLAAIKAKKESLSLSLYENKICNTFVSSILREACETGMVSMVEALFTKDRKGINRLDIEEYAAIAIEKHQNDILDFLCGHATVNANYHYSRDGQTLLTLAAMKNNIKAIKKLLALSQTDINTCNLRGYTPLGTALTWKNKEATLAFLENQQLDPNLAKNTQSPLVQAFYYGDEYAQIFESLLTHPNIDIVPLLKELEKDPKNLDSIFIPLLEKYYPEEMRASFSVRIESKISSFITQGQHEEANHLLETVWHNEASCKISQLMKYGPEIEAYLHEKHRQSLISWSLEDEKLMNMSEEEQIVILNCIFGNMHEYIGNKILAHKGIQVVIDYLTNKGTLFPGWPVSVCKDYISFKNELKLLEANQSLPNNYYHLFLISRFYENKSGSGGHVTPLFLNKENNAWKVIITDSTTNTENAEKLTSSSAPLVCLLQEIEREAKGSFPINKIYVNTFWRQYDKISCPIFAIRDLVAFNESGQELLQQLATNPKNDQVEYFSILPPQFMKPTQSLNDIDLYLSNKSNPYKNEMWSKKPPYKDETLEENVKRHTMLAEDGSGRLWNTLATERGKKYRKIVLNTLVERLKEIQRDKRERRQGL